MFPSRRAVLSITSGSETVSAPPAIEARQEVVIVIIIIIVVIAVQAAADLCDSIMSILAVPVLSGGAPP